MHEDFKNIVKNTIKENECLYKKQRNECIALRKKSINKYFINSSKQNIASNKNFWKVMKPFLAVIHMVVTLCLLMSHMVVSESIDNSTLSIDNSTLSIELWNKFLKTTQIFVKL